MSTTFVLPFSGELDGTTELPADLLYKQRPAPLPGFTPMERRNYYPDGYEPSPLVTPLVDIGLIDVLLLTENTRFRPTAERSGADDYLLNFGVCPTDIRNRVIVQIIGIDGCIRFAPFVLPTPHVVGAIEYLVGTRYALPIVTGDTIRILWDPSVPLFPGGGVISVNLLPVNAQIASVAPAIVNLGPAQ